jgi:hypothetical protein
MTELQTARPLTTGSIQSHECVCERVDDELSKDPHARWWQEQRCRGARPGGTSPPWQVREGSGLLVSLFRLVSLAETENQA